MKHLKKRRKVFSLLLAIFLIIGMTMTSGVPSFAEESNEEGETEIESPLEQPDVKISIDPEQVEWAAEEGYKGANDDGIEEDAISQNIIVTNTGSEEVEFVLAGFKEMASHEQFMVSAGGMEVTVAPREGLAPGTYTCVVTIGDWEDRFEDVEVPVTFTVTAKEEEPTDELADESVDDPADEPNDEPTDESTKTSEESADKNDSKDSEKKDTTPAKEDTPPKKSAAPNTGDDNTPALWFLIMCAVIGIMLGIGTKVPEGMRD